MKYRILTILLLSAFSFQCLAQVSDGQITRKNTQGTRSKKENTKRNVVKTSSSSTVHPTASVQIIQPTPITDLSIYNVVVSSMGMLENANGLCQSLREKWYSSLIYHDTSASLYRVTIGSTNNEQEAINLRDQARNTYPDAWILYIVNGHQERYR